ncbi:tape measure protein, partial [Candidatus Saccharibacteria bacterium]|nr:tape measure protein [Candidatus Saccharibacteria bacterium]
MSDRLDGLPTTLNGIVGDVQKLTATLGNLNTGTVNATSLGLALNDMFLAGGKGTQAASNAMEQYNQMLAAGKPDMQSWRSILDAAPGQLNQLAKTLLGATANQNDLYEALKNGTVRFDDLNAAIVRLDSEGGEGFESFEAQARAATGGLGTALENVQNRIGKAIAKVIDHIGSEKIAEAINGISAGFSGVADVVIGIVDFLSQNTWILDLITGFFVGLFAMGIASKVMGFFTMLTTFAATNPVVLAIGAISAVLFLIMTHLDEVGAFFETVFGAIGEFVGGVATVIGDFFGGVFDGIMAGVQAVGDFFNGVFTTIGAIVGGAFETVKNAAQGAWNFITGIFSGLANFFGSIFSGAWEAVKAV